MSRRNDSVTLRQMLEHAKEAYELLKGNRRSILEDDPVLSLAVIRLLEVLGEAADRVSAATRRRTTTIPWRQISGLRNRLIHAYDTVDTDVLWGIVINDLPALIRQLEQIDPVPPGPSAESAAQRAVLRKPSPGFTEKQGQYLAFINAYTKLHGVAPAEADLERYFRVSPPSVHQMILNLEKRQLIERTPGQARSIRLIIPSSEIPELGSKPKLEG